MISKEKKNTLHIASCSFGKDSLATILLALEHGEPLDEAVYCEVMFDKRTSGEVPEHRAFTMRLRSPDWNGLASRSVCCVRIRPIWICLQEQLPAVRKKDFGADSLCAGIATFSGTVSSVPSAGITGL